MMLVQFLELVSINQNYEYLRNWIFAEMNGNSLNNKYLCSVEMKRVLYGWY